MSKKNKKKRKIGFASSGYTKSGRANERKLITDRFDRASDILIQARVARLVDGRFVLFAPHKKIGRINLTDI